MYLSSPAETLWDLELRELEALARSQAHVAPCLLAALHEVKRTPYGYDPDGTHVSWDAVTRRGYAACGEAAAYLAAAALREGRRVLLRLLRSPTCGPAYSHVVAVVEGVTLDPYRCYSCPSGDVVVAEREVTR